MNTATDNQPLDQNDGAIVEVKPDNALVVLNPQKYAEELFAPYSAQLTQAKRRAGKATYDVATNEGKVALRAIIRSFVTIRTSSDKAKTEAKRPIDQAGKAILAVVAPIAAACKTEEEKYQQILDAQLAAEEAEKQRKIEAERVRVEQIENRIAAIRAITHTLAQASSEVVAAKLQELVEKQLDPAMYDEHLEDAVRALNNSIDGLREIHMLALEREQAARQAEENARELARLKAEQAERERVAAAEQAERDAQFALERQEARERDEAAARDRAALEQQLADMKAQMAAMQAAANPAPAPAPGPEVEAEPAPAAEVLPELVPAAREELETIPDELKVQYAARERDEADFAELLRAVRNVHASRSSADIMEAVADELDALDAGEGK